MCVGDRRGTQVARLVCSGRKRTVAMAVGTGQLQREGGGGAKAQGGQRGLSGGAGNADGSTSKRSAAPLLCLSWGQQRSWCWDMDRGRERLTRGPPLTRIPFVRPVQCARAALSWSKPAPPQVAEEGQERGGGPPIDVTKSASSDDEDKVGKVAAPNRGSSLRTYL